MRIARFLPHSSCSTHAAFCFGAGPLALVIGCVANPAVIRDSTTPSTTTSTTAATSESLGDAPASSEPAFDVPSDWDRMTHERFEEAARTWFPDGRRTVLTATAIAELSGGLARAGEASVRAAILLGRSRDPQGFESLAISLERRIDRTAQGEPTGDACDVLSAAALGQDDARGVRDCGKRLEGLATGKRPHPDLDVRVECAASALALGRTRVIAFLVKILREGTPSQASRVDWKRDGNLEFAQMRAAEALARHARVPLTYRPEASLAAREAEAARLETLLAPPAAEKKR